MVGLIDRNRGLPGFDIGLHLARLLTSFDPGHECTCPTKKPPFSRSCFVPVLALQHSDEEHSVVAAGTQLALAGGCWLLLAYGLDHPGTVRVVQSFV
jgi:hypothetical protein